MWGDAAVAVRAGAAELATFVCRNNSDMTCSDDASLASQAIFHGRKWAGRSEGKILLSLSSPRPLPPVKNRLAREAMTMPVSLRCVAR